MEPNSVIKLAAETWNKKGKVNPDLICNWKLHNGGDSDEEDIDDQMTMKLIQIMQHMLGCWGSPGYVSQLDELLVEQRLNRSLPVSLWTLWSFNPY